MKNIKLLKLVPGLIVSFLLLSVTAGFAANWKTSIGIVGTLTDNYVAASPVLGPDGTIYITAGAQSGGGNLYSVNPNGTINWMYPLAASSTGEGYPSPAVDGNGHVYVDSNLSLLSINTSSGTENWSYTVDGEADTSPIIGADGTVYFVADDPGKLFAFANNQLKWIYNYTDAEFESSPFVGSDGTIYVKTEDGLFANSSSDGAQKWHVSVSSAEELDLPPIMGNNQLYVSSSDGNLYALNPADGSLYGHITRAQSSIPVPHWIHKEMSILAIKPASCFELLLKAAASLSLRPLTVLQFARK